MNKINKKLGNNDKDIYVYLADNQYLTVLVFIFNCYII